MKTLVPDFISNIARYKDGYLVISGSSGYEALSIVDSKLGVVHQCKFEGVSVWGADIHTDEESAVLISVVTTGTFPLGAKTYQGFNVLWYELIDGKRPELKLIDTWAKCDITRIKSKVINGKRHWVCLRQLHFINQSGHHGERCVFGIAETDRTPSVPEFNYNIAQHKYLKTNFDFDIIDDNLYVSGICNISWNNPTIIRINRQKRNVEYLELDIPLKDLHDFESTQLAKINGRLYAYFWISSQEFAKKYYFQMFKVSIDNAILAESKIDRVINDSDFVHAVVWGPERYLSFKKVYQEPKAYLSALDDEGNVKERHVIDDWTPVFFGHKNQLVCVDSSGKTLKLIGFKN